LNQEEEDGGNKRKRREMGRGKIEIKKIENKTSRQVTFSKRRNGLIKKTRELSVLCDAHIGLIVFSATGKLTQYCSEHSNMPQLIDRYLTKEGLQLPDLNDDRDDLRHEIEILRRETCKLELRLRPYHGHDLASIPPHELDGLEHQLEHSVHKVRERKKELLQQQLGNLSRKRRMLEDDNNNMYRWLHDEHRTGIEFQQAEIETKPMEYQQFLEHVQYYNDHHQQQSSVLQLPTLPSEIDLSYHLQLAQPNFQNDPTITKVD
ncbi:unnamed protein product, partial [Brassica oleracea]